MKFSKNERKRRLRHYVGDIYGLSSNKKAKEFWERINGKYEEIQKEERELIEQVEQGLRNLSKTD